MTNLEAKQDAIKKGYGEENFTFFKGIIGENGWIGLSRYDFEEDLESEKKFDEMISEIEFEESFEDEQVFYRPKSLQGIENNNGWIKIESDDDIPKNDMYVHIVFNKKMNIAFLCDGEFFAPNKEKYYKKGVTHYQPIETKKQPIW